MAEFKPYQILSTQLDTFPIKQGQFILTTDTKMLYVDISETERILIDEKSNTAPKIYFSSTEPEDIAAGDIWAVTEE